MNTSCLLALKDVNIFCKNDEERLCQYSSDTLKCLLKHSNNVSTPCYNALNSIQSCDIINTNLFILMGTSIMGCVIVLVVGCCRRMCGVLHRQPEEDTYAEFDEEDTPSDQHTVEPIVNPKTGTPNPKTGTPTPEKNSDDDSDDGLPHYNQVTNSSFNK